MVTLRAVSTAVIALSLAANSSAVASTTAARSFQGRVLSVPAAGQTAKRNGHIVFYWDPTSVNAYNVKKGHSRLVYTNKGSNVGVYVQCPLSYPIAWGVQRIRVMKAHTIVNYWFQAQDLWYHEHYTCIATAAWNVNDPSSPCAYLFVEEYGPPDWLSVGPKQKGPRAPEIKPPGASC